jgi:hypothetical protein
MTEVNRDRDLRSSTEKPEQVHNGPQRPVESEGDIMSIRAEPDEPGYRYKIGSHLSAATYSDADSARRDARRPQFLRADGRIEPAEPVMFVLAMEELGIHFCGRRPRSRT